MTQDPRISELMTVDQAKKAMGISRGSLHYRINKGTVKSVRLGRYHLIYKNSIKGE